MSRLSTAGRSPCSGIKTTARFTALPDRVHNPSDVECRHQRSLRFYRAQLPSPGGSHGLGEHDGEGAFADEAQEGRRGQGAVVEAMRRLRRQLVGHQRATNVFSSVLILLTLVLVALTIALIERA